MATDVEPSPASAPVEAPPASGIPTAAPAAARPRGYAARPVDEVGDLLAKLAQDTVANVMAKVGAEGASDRGAGPPPALWIVPTARLAWAERVAAPAVRSAMPGVGRGRTVNGALGDLGSVAGAVKDVVTPVTQLLGTAADRTSLVSVEEAAEMWVTALLGAFRARAEFASRPIRVAGSRGEFPPSGANVLVTQLIASTLLWRRRWPTQWFTRSAALAHWVLLRDRDVVHAAVERA